MWDFLDLCFVVIFLLNPVCFGFLCDASSPPLHCEVAAWLYIPFVFFQPLHSVCCWWVRARERERGKRDVWGPGAPLAKDPLSQLLAQGWFGVRDAKVEKRLKMLVFQDLRWKLWNWKTGSYNPTTWHFFWIRSLAWMFSNWTSFLPGHCLSSLFSVLPMTVLLSCNHRWWYQGWRRSLRSSRAAPCLQLDMKTEASQRQWLLQGHTASWWRSRDQQPRSWIPGQSCLL